ncbi:MAG: efflux RND transporter periplasmic adaptor subunit [Methylococcales bacterium]|nr:efflux RND transporter periplasmic adaptor subunit [Methylococcales bacterium]
MKYLLPLLALVGLFFAGYTVVSSNQPMPIAQAVAEPSFSPFKEFIAGAGIIEAKSQNIAIGTPLPRIVTRVAVKVGDAIKEGSPLFYLDERDTRADLAIKEADLAKASASVNEAKAALIDTQTLENLAESVTDKRAISREELLRRHNAVAIAQAKLDSAKAVVQQAQASIANSKTTLERLIVRSPIDGEVLQVNIRAGEFAQAGALTIPLMLVGNIDQLHVRVDIDENDAWRFDKHTKAVAYLRGNRAFKVELELAYLEPFVIPKKSLTGDSTERVDTRVLQALYSFDRKQLPFYIGQQMDVFIETQAATGKGL